jgi:DNA-binding NarL/FixJ family response regulator
MSGREVADLLCARRPELKVLFISGYSEPAGLSHESRGDVAPLLQKPFSLADLAAKVREVLDGAPAPGASPPRA